jgi:hypothetical protein
VTNLYAQPGSLLPFRWQVVDILEFLIKDVDGAEENADVAWDKRWTFARESFPWSFVVVGFWYVEVVEEGDGMFDGKGPKFKVDDGMAWRSMARA